MRLVANGASTREAAATLFAGEATVKAYLLHVSDKLGGRERAAAVGEAHRRHLLPRPPPAIPLDAGAAGPYTRQRVIAGEYEMSKRRVDNLLGLAVLSVIFSRPMHPYEIARELRERGKDEDMEIKWGSFYTVVRNLEKHGLIEARASSRQGARPERTVYGITDDGRDELRDWTRELIAVPRREHPSFEAGLSVLGGLEPEEAATLLERRLEALRDRIETQRESLERARQRVPRLFLVESEYDLTLIEAEAAWVRGLLGELRAGSFPGLVEWRRFHRRHGSEGEDGGAMA